MVCGSWPGKAGDDGSGGKMRNERPKTRGWLPNPPPVPSRDSNYRPPTRTSPGLLLPGLESLRSSDKPGTWYININTSNTLRLEFGPAFAACG